MISNGYGFDRCHGVNDKTLRIRSLKNSARVDIVFERQEIAGRLWTHVVGNTFVVLLAYYLNWTLGTDGR